MMVRALDSATARLPGGDDRWRGLGVFASVCIVVIGIFTWGAEPGYLELKSHSAKDSYYNLLVQGFQAGQLDLKKEAPPELGRLADPYDPAENADYIGDVSDMSYYHGKLYLYFGVTPALTLLWPYAAVTGHYLTDKEAVVTFYAVGLVAAAGLLYSIWRRYFPDTSVWVPAAGLLALGLAAGTLDVSLWCDVYEVAVSCGFAFMVLAVAAVWQALQQERRRILWLMLASLAYGLAVGSRPSLLFGAIILLLPAGWVWRSAPEAGARRQVVGLIAAAVAPITLVGMGLMIYNQLRFQNPLEFGWHYQLGAGYNPSSAHQFSLNYFWFNFRFYFLDLMRWSRHFPFLQTVTPPTVPDGYFGVGKSYGGILFVYFPLVWVALAVPLAWKNRSTEQGTALRWLVGGAFLLFLACGVTLCLFLSASSRYELDFMPPLMLVAVIGLLGLDRLAAENAARRHWIRGGWGLLAVFSVICDLMITLESHAEANYFAGNYFVRKNEPEKSLAYFQSALALEPGSSAFHAGLGTAYYRAKQVDQALAEFQTAFQAESDFADAVEAHNDFGYCLLAKGRANEAAAQFQKTLASKPDFAEAHNALGDCRLQAGRMAEAIAEYATAVKIKPDYVDAHNNLGFAYFRAGQVKEAIEQFQRVLEIQPQFAEAHYNLACGLVRNGQLDDAVMHFQKAIELEPTLLPAYHDLGDAYRQQGKAAEAIAVYQKALKLQPNFASVALSLAWTLATWPEASVHNGQQAVELAERVNKLLPKKDPLTLRVLAASYAEAGRFPEAVAAAKQGLELAKAQSDTNLTRKLGEELEIYQENKSCGSNMGYDQ